MDYVKCNNCGKESLTATGSDVCPHCGYNGGLQWGDLEKKEDGAPEHITDELYGGAFRAKSDENALLPDDNRVNIVNLIRDENYPRSSLLAFIVDEIARGGRNDQGRLSRNEMILAMNQAIREIDGVISTIRGLPEDTVFEEHK